MTIIKQFTLTGFWIKNLISEPVWVSQDLILLLTFVPQKAHQLMLIKSISIKFELKPKSIYRVQIHMYMYEKAPEVVPLITCDTSAPWIMES